MSPAEILRELEELDSRLERLRIKYDQFFTGTEKALPYVLRKDVDRRFQALHRESIRNTGARFRFQTLVQRFTSYQTYWNRILRQIEEGTFRRDVIRAQRLGLGTQAVRDARRTTDSSELDADDLEEVEAVEPEPEPARPAADKPPAVEPMREVIPLAAQVAAAVPARPATLAPGRLALRPAASPPAGATEAAPPGTRPSAPTIPAVAGPPAPTVRLPLPPGVASPAGASRLAPPPPASPVRPPPASVANTSPPATARPPVTAPPPPARPPVTAPPPPARPPVTAPPPPARPPAASGDDAAMRNLFDRYVAARRQTGEAGELRYETVAKQVRDTLPRLAEKYQGADVRLDVTIKDGKAILRPVVTVKK